MVERGEHVYKRGEENNKIFFILKGKAVVTYPAKTDKEKQELEASGLHDNRRISIQR